MLLYLSVDVDWPIVVSTACAYLINYSSHTSKGVSIEVHQAVACRNLYQRLRAWCVSAEWFKTRCLSLRRFRTGRLSQRSKIGACCCSLSYWEVGGALTPRVWWAKKFGLPLWPLHAAAKTTPLLIVGWGTSSLYHLHFWNSFIFLPELLEFCHFSI